MQYAHSLKKDSNRIYSESQFVMFFFFGIILFFIYFLYSHLSLCGSSVSLEAVKEILINCQHLNSINLSSCRGLPRGVKRLMQGATEIKELREALGVKLKTPPVQTTT